MARQSSPPRVARALNRREGYRAHGGVFTRFGLTAEIDGHTIRLEGEGGYTIEVDLGTDGALDFRVDEIGWKPDPAAQKLGVGRFDALYRFFADDVEAVRGYLGRSDVLDVVLRAHRLGPSQSSVRVWVERGRLLVDLRCDALTEEELVEVVEETAAIAAVLKLAGVEVERERHRSAGSCGPSGAVSAPSGTPVPVKPR